MRDIYHVIRNKKGGWDVKKSTYYHSKHHFNTQSEAINSARIFSKRYGCELIIHEDEIITKHKIS